MKSLACEMWLLTNAASNKDFGYIKSTNIHGLAVIDEAIKLIVSLFSAL